MGTVNAAVQLLAGNLERHPDKTAYCCGDRAISYRELDRECRRFALLLREKGLPPGERVLLVLPDTFAFPVAFLGCLLAGVTAVAAGTALRQEDFALILEDSGARLLVTHPDLTSPRAAAGDRIEALFCDDHGSFPYTADSITELTPYSPGADDFAFMLYSSGSTGKPKGIPHRHADLILPCELMGGPVLHITSDDVIFSASKFSFAYGLINSLAFPLFFGVTAIIHPGKPDPVSVLGIFRDRRPTIFFSVPTMYSQLILSCTTDRLDLPMRLCYSAGEALPASIFEEWRRLTGLEILDGIGSTEMLYVFISNRPGNARPGSTGRPVPGYRLRLVDDHGADVPPGAEGNLLVHGPTKAPCYWNLPGKSAETMLPDGFCRTGDVFVEREGYYYHQGRSDDMIKAGAHWVSPVPLEEALLSHPSVEECAVAAVSAGALLRPGAFIILAPGTMRTPGLARELRDHLLERIPEYMCPVRFTFVDELPRTTTGKIQRFRLRDRQFPKGEQYGKYQ
jgi:benzoate-CoA ligase